MKKLEIAIIPTLNSMESDYGDSYGALFAQGWDTRFIDVGDNKVFNIEEGFLGRVNSDDEYYLLSEGVDPRDKSEYLIQDDLPEGTYRLSARDHVTTSLFDAVTNDICKKKTGEAENQTE